jgi:hypothetical protein
MRAALLQPVVALLIWTCLMWVWLYATRIPSMLAARVDMSRIKSAADLRAVLPERVSWVSDNYNHLHEQPLLFYTSCLLLVIAGGGDNQVNVLLGWAYVALRILHSLWQALSNRLPHRFYIFAAASLCLFAIIARAALMLF